MYVANEDELVMLEDSRVFKEILGSSVIHYEELKLSHQAFMYAKSMDFFNLSAKQIIDQYNER